MLKAKAGKIPSHTGFHHMLIDESDVKSGDPLMLWWNHVKITELSMPNQHIDVIVEEREKWRLMVYTLRPN